MAKLNKFTKKAAEYEAWGSVLQFANEQKKNYMEAKTDGKGEYIKDENDEIVYEPPKENDYYSYSAYIGWCEVIKSLENMKI